MSNFLQVVPRKQEHWVDRIRREHAIKLLPNVPLRVHGDNGGYLFSIIQTENGTYKYDDKRFGNRRTKASRVL